MPNNTKLDIVGINDYANVGQNQLIRSQDIERKRNSDVVQDRDSVTNWRKWTFNNHKLYVVNINASAKFGQNIFIQAQDIEWKRNSLNH